MVDVSCSGHAGKGQKKNSDIGKLVCTGRGANPTQMDE